VSLLVVCPSNGRWISGTSPHVVCCLHQWTTWIVALCNYAQSADLSEAVLCVVSVAELRYFTVLLFYGGHENFGCAGKLAESTLTYPSGVLVRLLIGL